MTRRRPRTRKDSCRVRPIQEDVESDPKERGSIACRPLAASTIPRSRHTYPRLFRRQKSNRSLNPDGPTRDAVDKYEGEVGGA